jgi:hypothetical protein
MNNLKVVVDNNHLMNNLKVVVDNNHLMKKLEVVVVRTDSDMDYSSFFSVTLQAE